MLHLYQNCLFHAQGFLNTLLVICLEMAELDRSVEVRATKDVLL